ncbi:MAG: NUDIX hydrolase [Halobacteriaceae archaeon]
MDIEAKTRRDIDDRLAGLRDRFGSFAIAEETVENDPEFFASGRDRAREGWIGDAGAWVIDEDGHALMIRHAESPDQWGVPGGGHEPGETMAETARREVREETGVDCTLTDVIYARRRTVELATDSAQQFQMLTVIFEAQYQGGTIEISDDEVLEARWFAEPPDSLPALIDEQVADWSGTG